MKFYTIYPSSRVDRDFAFILKSNRDKVIDYFKFNDASTGFLKHPRINLTYEAYFNEIFDEVLKADFYYCSEILLFSKKFYDSLKNELAAECDFFNCLVNNKESNIYAMFIKNKYNILKENEEVLETAIMDSDYIFRDALKPYIYMVTENFVKLVYEKKLEMQFLEF